MKRKRVTGPLVSRRSRLKSTLLSAMSSALLSALLSTFAGPAAAQGPVDYEDGMGFFKYQNYRDAFSAFSRCAKKGLFPGCNHMLGVMQFEGFGGDKNYRAAFAEFLTAANRDYAPSMIYLSRFYQSRLVDIQPPDPKKAEEWLLKAKNLGHLPAYGSLSLFYAPGNPALAHEYLLKGADLGDPSSLFGLFDVYDRGGFPDFVIAPHVALALLSLMPMVAGDGYSTELADSPRARDPVVRKKAEAIMKKVNGGAQLSAVLAEEIKLAKAEQAGRSDRSNTSSRQSR